MLMTTDMWPRIFRDMRSAGLNTVETYIFWDAHEPQRGVFDFEGEKDVRKFVKLAQEHGLFVVLRYGPYVCAEWSYGGLPVW
jgi:beta-galactosidase GanA